MENIISLFIRQAEQNPNAIAIIENGKAVSFAELLEEVQKTASYFISKGITTNDRVLVFVPVSLDLYRTVLALFYIGASAVFIDEWVSFKRLSLCCKIAECKAFIAPFKLKVLSYLSADLRKIDIRLSLSGRGSGKNIPLFAPQIDSTALITFTTGSTGTPKAANRTHQFLQYQFDALKPLLNAHTSETDLTMLPIVLLLNLGLGKTSVIPQFNARKPKKFKPEVLVSQIKTNKVEVLTSSPFYLISLAAYLLKNDIRLTSIQKIFTGGAPVFPYEAQMITKAFPDVQVTIVFGSTEAEPISHIDVQRLSNTDQRLLKGLPVGTIDNHTQLLILPINENAIEINSESELKSLQLAKGRIGEICVTGNHVLRSYIKNPEAIRMNKIITGQNTWHRTGDAGFVDDDEQLYLLGRCKQIIHTSNRSYYPFLVEDFCRKQQGVILGTLVSKKGAPVFVLEINKHFQKELFITNAKANNLDFDIQIVKSIPRDPRHFSKIDYAKLELEV